MLVLDFSANGELAEGALLFVGIRMVVAPNSRHVGLIYLRTDNRPYICHLQWHFRLVNETFSGGYFVGASALDIGNQTIVAAWLQDLPRQLANVPYGLDATGCGFDRASGEYLPGPFGKGLTCATFVTAVFGTLGLPLADYTSWPNRTADVDWQNDVLGLLRQHGAEEDYVTAVSADVGSIRVRPEELVSAVLLSCPPPVLTFEQIEQLSLDVLAQLAA